MPPSLTFKGKLWKVQLQVFDFDNPLSGPAMDAQGKPRVIFSVAILPLESHPSTAFHRRSSTVLYHGPLLAKALSFVELYLGEQPQLPKGWAKYQPPAPSKVTPPPPSKVTP